GFFMGHDPTRIIELENDLKNTFGVPKCGARLPLLNEDGTPFGSHLAMYGFDELFRARFDTPQFLGYVFTTQPLDGIDFRMSFSFEFLPDSAPATLPAPVKSPSHPFSFWDGEESVAAYAARVNLPPTKSLDIGGGEKIELILIPAGEFTMGTSQPVPVDET